MRLLLVEDDHMIGETVVDVLRAEHFAVDWIKDGASAQAVLCTQTYDLLLLDLALPGKDCLDVLRATRSRCASSCATWWTTASSTRPPAARWT